MIRLSHRIEDSRRTGEHQKRAIAVAELWLEHFVAFFDYLRVEACPFPAILGQSIFISAFGGFIIRIKHANEVCDGTHARSVFMFVA